jgi:Glycosyl transferase family 2
VINAVAVVVPAHDEQDHIVACLTSLRVALNEIPADIAAVVTVVLDRCTDRTPERVAAVLGDWPEAEAIPATASQGSGVGALRDFGLRSALGRLADHRTDRIWLLSTDADTTVPADWASHHLRLADAGAHGVAGLAELADDACLSPNAILRYERLISDGLDGTRHDHVYSANLGCRADAYLAAGGFPTHGPGEDHGLWARLRAGGYQLEQPTTLRVRTSARLHGRASDGLAGLLHSLHTAQPDTLRVSDQWGAVGNAACGG